LYGAAVLSGSERQGRSVCPALMAMERIGVRVAIRPPSFSSPLESEIL
jgi:hypothetical protein